MKYWLYWNQRCEERASVTYRVENMAALMPNFLRRLGVESTAEVLENCRSVPQNDHTRQQGHKK